MSPDIPPQRIRIEALVLGIGNVLWADEGFGVRAVEALHEAYVFPPEVVLQDGGTLGLALYEAIASARRVLFSTRSISGSPGARSSCCATTKCRRGDAPACRRINWA